MKTVVSESKRGRGRPLTVGGRVHRKPLWNTPLRELRTKKGLTLMQASEQIGIQLKRLSDMELGYGVCLIAAMKVAKFYGKTVEELWTPLDS